MRHRAHCAAASFIATCIDSARLRDTVASTDPKSYQYGVSLRDQYRNALHLRYPAQKYHASATDIPHTGMVAFLRREKTSHRGISKHRHLRELCAFSVDQAFLEEICQLDQLEYLELGWPVTAKDLSPLRNLKLLRYLAIDTPGAIADFTPILEIPGLDSLSIVNAKQLRDIGWLRPLKKRLRVLGVEGSISTTQNIATLDPLAGFELEALFLTSTRLGDKSISVIGTMPKLRFLETAANAPKAEFMALKAEKPGLECEWFEEDKWQSLEALRPKTRKKQP